MRKAIYLLLCLACSVLARAQSSLTCRYWLDGNEQHAQTTTTDAELHLDVDVSGLSEGIHYVHAQVVDAEGVVSVPVTRCFVKVPQVAGETTLRCLVSIDDVFYSQEEVSARGDALHLDFDASGLSEGLHKISVLVMTQGGLLTFSVSSYFLRVNTTEELSHMKCYYSIDSSPFQAQTGTLANGVFHLDIDVAALTDGLHRVSSVLATESGTATSTHTAFFMKTPLGGSGVMRYEYWVNEDFEHRTQVAFSEYPADYNLIGLLPVPSYPLRSSSFRFEFKSGTPYIYAQNDFHIRFYDSTFHVVSHSASYADYNVSQQVRDAELLVSGQAVTKVKPADNTIQWYHFPAQIGDSLSFKVDRACTVQVFAPSGKEVYKASGYEAVNWEGCHAWEDGEYYLALHDVTDSYTTTTTLEYQHIDKYAVLRYSPNEMALVSGYVHVNLFGNGYGKLQRVSLRNEEYVINADTIVAKDVSNASAEFYIPANCIGKGFYDLVFEFRDSLEVQTLIQERAVTITDAQYGEIAIEVTSLPRTAKPYPVIVTIANKGNVCYQMIPLMIGFEDVGGIEEYGLMNGTIALYSEEDTIFSSPIYETDNMLGKGVKGVVIPVLLPELGAYETITLQVGFVAAPHTKFKFYTWCHIPWGLLGDTQATTSYCKANGPNSGGANKGGGNDSGGSGTGSGGSGTGSSGSGTGGSGSGGGTGSGTGGSGSGSGTGVGGGSTGDAGGSGTSVYPGESGNDVPIIPYCDYDPCGILPVGECLCGMVWGSIESIRGTFASLQNMSHMAQNQQLADAGMSYRLPLHELLSPEDIMRRVLEHCFNFGNAADNVIGNLLPKPLELARELATLHHKVGEYLNRTCPDPDPHDVDVFMPGDPNDMLGYRAPVSESKFVKKNLTDVYYNIEFENDSALANAAAHHIVIRDTLDSRLLDLATFTPTSVTFGGYQLPLDGTEQSFVKTLDMRPAINALAQISLEYDATTGIAVWDILSLDPMTLEPTDDAMMGILGVGGQGEVTFDIKLHEGLADGTEIPNRASIVFDQEEAIMTPTWVNTIDAVPPVSRVTDVEFQNDTTVTVHIEGEDARSGVWHYDVYVQQGIGAPWVLAVENADTTAVDVSIFEGIDYGFCVVATDMAGNVEEKELRREMGLFTYLLGDANGDGQVDLDDVTALAHYIATHDDYGINTLAADVNGDGKVSVADIVSLIDMLLPKDNE